MRCAIAAYIWSQSKEEGDKWTQENPPPAGLREGDANEVAKGKKLVETIGCKGCHGFAEGEFTTPLGKEKDLVPNLKDVAAKVTGPQWIYHWIKNPRGFSPDTRMPSLRLSDDEALAITNYLMTLGGRPEPVAGSRRKNLPMPKTSNAANRWCASGVASVATTSKGMEKESRIGAELTTFGSKTVEELVLRQSHRR